MLWFGFGYRGFGQLGSGDELTLNLPKPVQVKEAYLEKKKIVKAVPSWSYTAFVTEFSVTENSSIHLNETVLAVNTWISASPIHMDGTDAEISTTNLPLVIIPLQKKQLRLLLINLRKEDEGSLLLSGCIGGSPQQFMCFPSLDCRDVLPSEKYLIVLMRERTECWDVTNMDCEGTLPEPMWKMELSDVHSAAFPLVAKGHVLPQPPFFRELPPTLQAQKMALGNEHVVLLTSDGKVLTWGAGRHGQLGHGDVEDASKPRIVEALHGVTVSEVAAGGWHTVSISESGDLYCWGWNESGQLGLPSKALQQEQVISKEGLTGCDADEDSGFITIQSFPALIDLPQETEAAKVSCGSRHSAAVTRCGELYTWGWGKYGQLGHGDTKNLDQPKLVDFFYQNKFCVKDVTCRHWNTYVMCILEAK